VNYLKPSAGKTLALATTQYRYRQPFFFVVLLLTMACLNAERKSAAAQSPLAADKQNPQQQIFLVGDSTMADKPLTENPERGWGQIFRRYFDEQIHIENHAVNGRSTKSFREEGRWEAILPKLKKDDWVFIQFGHNDAKIEDPKRYAAPQTDYRNNLIRYVNEAREKGVKVLLITPVMRRRFDKDGKFSDSHGEYPDVVRDVAKQLNAPLFDLHKRSQTLIEQEGAEGSKKMFLHIPAKHFDTIKEAKTDDTHFSEYGASLIASLVCEGLRELNLDLAKHLQVSDFKGKYAYELPKIYEPHFSKQVFNIADFGAKPDGLTLNTKAINDAIVAAHKAGGGRVVIPKGIWLTGAIVLQSQVNLHLQKGALVTFSKNRDDFPLVVTSFEGVAAYRSQAPISALKADNVAITGEGIFDGGGDAWKPVKKGKITDSEWKKLVASGGVLSEDQTTWYPSESGLRGSITGDVGKIVDGKTAKDFAAVKDFLRPNMAQIIESKNILIDGVTFQNSPAWTLHFLLSEHITLRNVRVKNPWYGQNNDAVDLESSRNALLEGCVFDTGDDGITLKSGRDAEGRKRGVPTENIIANNCTVYHAHGGFVIGSEMSGGVRNVFISNSTFIGSDIGLRFKTTRGRGGVVENVYASNVDMKDIPGEAILFDMYYMAKDPIPLAGEKAVMPKIEKAAVNEGTPQFQNFFFQNITVQGAKKGIFVRGLPEMNIKNVQMENLTIQADEGIYCEEAEAIAIKNLTLLSKDTNPLVTIHNSKGVLLDTLQFPKGADLLMHLSGETTKEIRLLNTDVSNAKKDFQFAAEVSNKVLNRR
jgi:DNA sulfur modification protein DndE